MSVNNAFTQRLRLSQSLCDNMELDAAKLLVKYQIKLFTDTIWTNPGKIVWTNMVMPTELFYAADLIPVNMELLAGWTATLSLSSNYIHIAHAKGYHVNLCSYHKAVIGAIECGDLPPPKLVVLSSHICDGGHGMLQYFKRRHSTKTLFIDIPYHPTAANIASIEEKMMETKRMIEDFTRELCPMKKFNQAISYSNTARDYLEKANSLRKKNVLFYGNLAIRNMFGTTFLLGSELGVAVARAYYEQLCKIAAETNNIESKKPHRILWIHFAPLHASGIMRCFEEELNCVIAFDITGYVYWDKLEEDAPCKSIAQKAMSHFFLGNVVDRMALYKKIIKEYGIEGIVLFMHAGCRAIPGSSWEVRHISEELGIPCIELPGDCIDPGGFSYGQLKLRMEAFSENLERKRYVSGN